MVRKRRKLRNKKRKKTENRYTTMKKAHKETESYGFGENHKICKSESFTVIFRCRFRFFFRLFVPLSHALRLRFCVHIELSL